MKDADLIQLLDKQENNLKDFINGNGTLVRATMKAEVDRIDEMDKLRNGRINQNEDDIELLQDETRPARWVYRNPKVSAFILVCVLLLGAWGYHKISIKKTIENVTKIEFTE